MDGGQDFRHCFYEKESSIYFAYSACCNSELRIFLVTSGATVAGLVS
jgi:hypothetical protein